MYCEQSCQSLEPGSPQNSQQLKECNLLTQEDLPARVHHHHHSKQAVASGLEEHTPAKAKANTRPTLAVHHLNL
ncbi:hypothetical protein GJ744_000984 [Endocarpon pusillum]|uniref:Uncharacterized protein n=1 Tax=Endocarpon pusillum TaxID=364733 RepID=A0A8H7E268_9EURO|nr:hypothetical protein GJ744_000984 [Endocarpon pusillum]